MNLSEWILCFIGLLRAYTEHLRSPKIFESQVYQYSLIGKLLLATSFIEPKFLFAACFFMTTAYLTIFRHLRQRYSIGFISWNTPCTEFSLIVVFVHIFIGSIRYPGFIHHCFPSGFKTIPFYQTVQKAWFPVWGAISYKASIKMIFIHASHSANDAINLSHLTSPAAPRPRENLTL